MKVTAAREITSWVASDVAAALALRVLAAVGQRLGLSGGVLAGGAASSWASLGTTVVAAVVLDKIIDWILRRAGYDPEANIAQQVRASLANIQSLLLDGDEAEGPVRGGLRAELLRLHLERSRLRRDALWRFLFGSDQSLPRFFLPTVPRRGLLTEVCHATLDPCLLSAPVHGSGRTRRRQEPRRG
jgi:hypothetical protein